jgi:hypothetical protein
VYPGTRQVARPYMAVTCLVIFVEEYYFLVLHKALDVSYAKTMHRAFENVQRNLYNM